MKKTGFKTCLFCCVYVADNVSYLSMVAKNSSFECVLDILSFRNSIASTGVMSAKWFLSAQTLAKVRSSTSKSSRRVPEATISIAG